MDHRRQCQTRARPLWLLVGAVVAASATSADYPSPQSAGFHHCALIYNRAERSAEDLAPYVAELRDDEPVAWFFDSFLFLVYSLPSGRSPMTGDTVAEDWRWHLDRWFAPGRDLAALDEALARATQRLGPVPAKRQVMLSIPYPSRNVTDFGDVDGDGKSEDLSTEDGLRTVLAWYVREGRDRFAAADYKHLELWGFYWMREGIHPADEALTRTAADVVHAAGLKLFWIPWYRAPGWDRWRECGLDLAIMQPNYAFFSKHRGSIRRNRLAVNAHLAREQGMGVEVELSMFCNDIQTRHYFLRYLADGARYGYQHGATAYYLGVDNLNRLCSSEHAWQRDLYASLAAYVRGEVVPDPDLRTTWRQDSEAVPVLSDGDLDGGRPLTRVETVLAAPTTASAVDVFLDEPQGSEPWQGTVIVDVQREGAEGWVPAGWTIRSGRSVRDQRWQVVTVPVSQTVTAARVRLQTAAGSAPPSIAEIGMDACAVDRSVTLHLALNLPYVFSPASQARYGDDGNELTDGVVAETGFPSGQTVGWYGQNVTIAFDLGRVRDLDRVEVFVEGGGYAAVNWPASAALFTAAEGALPTRTSGSGAFPAGFAWTPAKPVVIDRERSADAANGRLVFVPPQTLKARYANILLSSAGWLMVSEVRVFSEGVNIAPEAKYALRPAPTPDGEESYPDDGSRLTDGIIATRFSKDALTGWSDDEPRVITLDLGGERAVRRVVTWAIAGGLYGVYAPKSVAVEVSADGERWRPAGAAERPAELVEDGDSKPLPYEVALDPAQPVRMIRVTAQRTRSWAMLSEIVVE